MHRGRAQLGLAPMGPHALPYLAVFFFEVFFLAPCFGAALRLAVFFALEGPAISARRLGSPYLPGSREAVQKVKGDKTADMVVVGVTWSEKGTGIASLALGLFEDGELRPVGSAPATGKKRAEILERVEPILGPNPERKPRGAPSRWKPKADLEWSSMPPELVVEVRYDKWQKGRIRHNARFLRFRPDKDPEQCTVDQVRPRRRKGDPTVPGLLARQH
jgi:ATP-dependent DNA ligase